MNDPKLVARAHVKLAEEQALNIPDLPANQVLRPIGKVGVVGAGTMGCGIAMNFANAGIPTLIVEASQAGLDRGLGIIRRDYEASAAKGKLTADDVVRRMALLSGTLDYAGLADCDLIIEAVFEDMALKRDVCAQVGAVAKPNAIIATNTSTLDVDLIADATGRPGDVVGLHFFSPANVMRLLEVVRGKKTAADVLGTVINLATRIAKTPVVAGVCYGFIGNRMAEVYMRETEFLLLEGASPAQIDNAVEALGMAMGPCRMLDMAGIDVGAKTVIEWKKSGGAPQDPNYRVVVDELYRLGRMGQKTGAGYYRYDGRTAISDPAVDLTIRGLAVGHGVQYRDSIDDREIVERLLFALVNEGCRILGEGISHRPGDIDVVWVAGYGFPADLGGPMFWAEQIGLATILKRLEHYGKGCTNGYWIPAPLLLAAVDSGAPLSAALKKWREHQALSHLFPPKNL